MVYASDSLSLAALEILVQADFHDLPEELIYVEAEIPPQTAAIRLGVEGLPGNWRSYPADAGLRECGSRWLRQNLTALLIVPSAVIPQQNNLLLNPAHPDFSKIVLGTAQDFALDSRLSEGRS
jgi:RES domain-containing protein